MKVGKSGEIVDIPKALRDAEKLAKGYADQHSEIGDLARAFLHLVETAIAELSRTALSRPARRGTGEMNYLVEETQQGEVLTEQKSSGSKPYRCPQTIYASLARVVATAQRPLLLDELMAAVEAETGDRPAEHQIRVALRLWMHVTPNLVMRNRARYRASDSITFVESAKNLWNQLRS